jgi:cystathionine gamma-lyase
VTVIDAEGNRLTVPKGPVALCRCGHSQTKPFLRRLAPRRGLPVLRARAGTGRMTGPSTRAVRAGLPAPAEGEPLLPGPTFAAAYHLAGPADASPYGYGRFANPTWTRLEAALGDLEGARAVAFASGMAAVAAVVVPVLAPGDVFVGPSDGYPGVRQIAREVLEPRGVEVRLVETADDAGARSGLRREHGVGRIAVEPGLDVLDLGALGALAAREGVTLVVDNTLAGPLRQRPLDLGAHVSVTSASKHLTGHGDLVLGYAAVAPGDDARAAALEGWRRMTGAVPGPFEAWLAHRSLATLALRLERQEANAAALADALRARDDVAGVRWPGVGSVVCFDLGSAERAQAFLRGCRLVAEATSFGGVHSTAERRARWGTDAVGEGFVRFSAGIEDADDLCADVVRGARRQRTLNAVPQIRPRRFRARRAVGAGGPMISTEPALACSMARNRPSALAMIGTGWLRGAAKTSGAPAGADVAPEQPRDVDADPRRSRELDRRPGRRGATAGSTSPHWRRAGRSRQRQQRLRAAGLVVRCVDVGRDVPARSVHDAAEEAGGIRPRSLPLRAVATSLPAAWRRAARAPDGAAAVDCAGVGGEVDGGDGRSRQRDERARSRPRPWRATAVRASWRPPWLWDDEDRRAHGTHSRPVDGYLERDGHRTWYRVLGDASDGDPLAPVVLCHGGPGATHDYLEPIAQLHRSGRACVLYDQLGNGRSDRLPDADPSFWTAALFERELTALTEHLGSTGATHVLGQSWGGMLALQHALERPPGLVSVVAADSPAVGVGLRRRLQRAARHARPAGPADDPRRRAQRRDADARVPGGGDGVSTRTRVPGGPVARTSFCAPSTPSSPTRPCTER